MKRTARLALCVVVLLIAACGCSQTKIDQGEDLTPTETKPPTDTPTPTATHTLEPSATPSPIPTATPDPLQDLGVIGYRVVEGNNRDYNYQKPDGSRTYWDSQPPGMTDAAWSPDGTRVVFVADWDGDDEIYVMNSDGSEIIQLTFNNADDGQPAWFPEGSQIVFASMRDPIPGYEGPPPEIYLMNVDGSGQTRLTNNNISDHSPSWSPDGNKIAFSSFHFSYEKGSRINTINPDGSEITLLVDLPGDDLGPEWSPDGSRLVFFSQFPRTTSIFLVNADGSGLKQLTVGGDTHHDPFWSPDGKWVVFASYGDEGDDLMVQEVDGSVRINITDSPDVKEISPNWIPWDFFESDN